VTPPSSSAVAPSSAAGSPASLLLLAQTAARAAASVLLAERTLVLAEGASATKSSVSDPVTRADVWAQEAIAEVLVKARPDDAIVSEEGLDRPGRSGWRWIIDPLDGTVNYLYGRDEWAVSIAVEDPLGTSIAAVVLAPALNRTYTATRGAGAWLDGQRLAVRPTSDLAHAVIGTGFSYTAATRATQAEILFRLLPSIADIRRAGSAALDLADVASGRIDAFYENDLAPWDWAAGALLASEAGAIVSELPGPAGRSGILASSPTLANPLTRLLSTHRPQETSRLVACKGIG
jgi:myo-inositol-1(or 4)-monophosphatase